MTVAELIEKLKEMPQEMEVLRSGWTGVSIPAPRRCRVFKQQDTGLEWPVDVKQSGFGSCREAVIL